MSNSGTPPLPRPEALKKLAQLRIERLKKEEEEEQWISGEELYTEGSSDEDDMAVRAKRRENEKGGKKSSRIGGTKPRKPMKDKLKSPSSLSPPQITLPSVSSKGAHAQRQEKYPEKDGVSASSVKSTVKESLVDSSTSASTLPIEEEVDTEISWRPKRGGKNGIASINEAEKDYQLVVERVNKLKYFLDKDSNITSWINESSASGFFGNKATCVYFDSMKTQNGSNLIKESCDVESALRNVHILDQLLEIITEREKEAREKTISFEEKVKEELSVLCFTGNDDNNVVDDDDHDDDCDDAFNELKENTVSFLQLFSKENDIAKVKKILDELNCEKEDNSSHNDLNCGSAEKFKLPEIILQKHVNGYPSDICCTADKKLGEEAVEEIPSITENEKERLSWLLQDVEVDVNDLSSESNNAENSGSTADANILQKNIIEAYSINNKTKQMLEEIDEKLEEFAKSSKESISEKLSFLPSSANNIFKQYELCEQPENTCLKDIDELLEFLNKPVDKEIQPLTQDQISDLVQRSKMGHQFEKEREEISNVHFQESGDEKLESSKPTPKVDSETMKKLIEEAETAMPLFKYKFSI